jgi:hypothetical protein
MVAAEKTLAGIKNFNFQFSIFKPVPRSPAELGEAQLSWAKRGFIGNWLLVIGYLL